MSNFKSGAGNLDFGSSDEDEENDDAADETTETPDEQEQPESNSPDQDTSGSTDSGSTETASASGQSVADRLSEEGSAAAGASPDEYPYFVRRSNVGDERDTRLEIHVRTKVANQEATFRSELADHLGANEVSKTDAREFALLAAFHHPERVAELMQDEGFGTLG